MGDGGCRGVCGSLSDHYFNVVCRKYLQRTRQCRLGERVGIHPEEERPVDLLELPVITNRLSNRENVPLVEGSVIRRSTMAGGAEHDSLLRIARIGPQLVVVRNKLGKI